MSGPTQNEDTQSVPEFYDKKSILLTGAAGFVGTVILEALLRCCPGIASIYILLRPKENLTAEQRRELIFEKKIFRFLKEQNPQILEKVHVIPGDISEPDLGMSCKDLQNVVDQVSIIFHCAAVLSLIKPLRYLSRQNAGSVDNMIKLCRKMKKFSVLVYTSTSYSNCNNVEQPIKEEVYRLPFHAKRFLDAMNDENEEKLEKLVSLCKPVWPIWYPFSKCLAENVLQDLASDLPIAIVRPSFVGCTWKSPFPGYMDEDNGLRQFCLGIAKGFIRVVFGDASTIVNGVPADVVANVHLIAAWSLGTKKALSPLVVNCTSNSHLHIVFSDFMKALESLIQQFPVPRSFRTYRSMKIIRNRFLYSVAVLYEHFIPGIVLDCFLMVMRKKPRVVATYYFIHKLLLTLPRTTLTYDRMNMDYLQELLHHDDRKILSTDYRHLTMDEYLTHLTHGSSVFDWKTDEKSPQERKKIMQMHDWMVTFIQFSFLSLCSYFIYRIAGFIIHLF